MDSSLVSDINYVEPNDLAYFACVVKHRSFTAAAKEIAISKSKLSRVVSCLEERIGIRLLERTSRVVTPTVAGELLYHHCKEVYKASLAARQTIITLTSAAYDFSNAS